MDAKKKESAVGLLKSLTEKFIGVQQVKGQ
jgi:hypothetical protein